MSKAPTQGKRTEQGPSIGTWALSAGAIGTLASPSLYTMSHAAEAPKPAYRPAPQTEAPNPMAVTEQLLNAKLEAVEARTDSKFAELLGEVRLIGRDVAHLSTNLGTLSADVGGVKAAVDGVKSMGTSIKWNIGIAGLTIGLTLGGLILGLFAYGTQMLDLATALLEAG